MPRDANARMLRVVNSLSEKTEIQRNSVTCQSPTVMASRYALCDFPSVLSQGITGKEKRLALKGESVLVLHSRRDIGQLGSFSLLYNVEPVPSG